MMEAAERSGGDMENIGVVIEYAKRAISKEILDRAEHILDVFEELGFFKEGKWWGIEGSTKPKSDYFWYETLVEHDSSALDEMYEIAIGPKFKEMEQEAIDSENERECLLK